MGKFTEYRRGWAKGAVPVDHAPAGLATVVEIRTQLSSLYFMGMVNTPDRLEVGEMLSKNMYRFSGTPIRAVVPRTYTHVKVETSSSPGIPMWKMGFGTTDDCDELRDTVRGNHPDVVQYRGPATQATLEIGRGVAELHRMAIDGTDRRQLESVSNGPFRGQVELSAGPVLLQVHCLVSWSLTIRD